MRYMHGLLYNAKVYEMCAPLGRLRPVAVFLTQTIPPLHGDPAFSGSLERALQVTLVTPPPAVPRATLLPRLFRATRATLVPVAPRAL